MEALFRQMELVAPTRSNVLIVGESGTGKELVANALHENSPRQRRPLPSRSTARRSRPRSWSPSCSATSGARSPGPRRASSGSSSWPTAGRCSWTRSASCRWRCRSSCCACSSSASSCASGGSETIRVDIRLVAATNADLESAVEQGRFRSDLYYRLKVVTLRIPPLRERREDIPLLANHFLQMFARENDRERDALRPPRRCAPSSDARWEGNVRELRNLVESLVVLTPHDEITVEDLPDEYRAAGAPRTASRRRPDRPQPAAEPPCGREPAPWTRSSADAILAALEQTGGNRTQAAELLGIGLRTLQRKLKEYRDAADYAGRGHGVLRQFGRRSPPFWPFPRRAILHAVRSSAPRLLPACGLRDRAPRHVSASKARYTVLVVDDDPSVLACTTAVPGPRRLPVADRGGPLASVLTDGRGARRRRPVAARLRMPGMDGPDAARTSCGARRAGPLHPRLRVPQRRGAAARPATWESTACSRSR